MSKKIYIILAIYLVSAVLIFKYYQYYIITDLVPYIDIAKKYLNGDFFHAINGIWGVLISWLLMPFLWLGIDSVLSFKILNIVIGAFTIVGFHKLTFKFPIHSKVQTLLLYISIPIVLTFALVHTTPDLLVACILLYYLNVIFDDNYIQLSSNAVFLGFLAGLGYLAKHYVFVFMAIHLVLSHLFYFFSLRDTDSRKKILRNFILSYGIFLLISSFWIFAQSTKYGYVTIGTSPAYNRAWMAPDSLGHAPEYMGLVPPPNSTASSMWEDLTYYTHLMPNYGWSPFASWKNVMFQTKLVGQNLKETFLIINKFSLVFGLVILILSLVEVFKKIRKRDIFSDKIFFSLVAITIYSSGYLLIRTSDRYIWIVCFLMLILGGVYLSKFYLYISEIKNKNLYIGIICLLFSISFLVTPMRRFYINIYQDKDIYDISRLLGNYGVGGNLASNVRWSNTSILSWYLDSTYLGMPIESSNLDSLSEQFDTFGVDYFFEWKESPYNLDIDKIYQVLLVLDDLVVYKIKQ